MLRVERGISRAVEGVEAVQQVCGDGDWIFYDDAASADMPQAYARIVQRGQSETVLQAARTLHLRCTGAPDPDQPDKTSDY
jgi:hypothetical protein